MKAKGWMELDEILGAMEPPPGKLRKGAHSPVYEGMWAWFDRLTPHINPPRRPDWEYIAQKLAARGFTNVDGDPPTANLVRQTWPKVRRDKERQAAGIPRKPRGKAAAKAKAQPVAEAAPAGVPPVKPPPVDDTSPTDDGVTFAGGPRKWEETK